MDYNKIAKKIGEIQFVHSLYEELIHDNNIKAELVRSKSHQLEVEPLNFESFDEEYLDRLSLYWDNKRTEIEEKTQELRSDVDTDDYK